MKALLQEKINEAVARIAVALRPEKIFLFGSHAWGEPGPDSDIDLFVIIAGDPAIPVYKLASQAYRSLRGLKEPFEVIVRTSREVERERQVSSSLVSRVLRRGRLLYG